jgi:23S rRNA (guanosine2251-2'-O)-methyltransferase
MREVNIVSIEGKNMVHDALVYSPDRVNHVLLTDRFKDDARLTEIKKLAHQNSIRIEIMSRKQLDKESESGNSQGVRAEMKLPEAKPLKLMLEEKRDIFLLLLDKIEYEQNLGAIMRTAWAAGVDAVVVSPDGINKVTPVVAKVSMGAAAQIPLISQSMYQTLDLLERMAVKVIGVEVDKGKSMTEENLTGPVAILMGSEYHGLTEQMMKKCTSLVHIPMKNNVASLNVSTATALVCFEKMRQEK